MTDITAVLARVRALGESHSDDWLSITRGDRDALMAHVADLTSERDEAQRLYAGAVAECERLSETEDAQRNRITALEGALIDVLSTRGIPRREEYLSEIGLQGAIDADKRARALLTEKTR